MSKNLVLSRQIPLTAHNATAEKVLNILGHIVRRIENFYGDDPVEMSYRFEHRGSADSIGVDGEFSIGRVIGLYNDDSGALISIVDFGELANVEYEIDADSGHIRLSSL